MTSTFIVLLIFWFFQGVNGAITSLSQTTKPNAGQPVTLLCEATNTPSVPGPNALTLTGPDGSEVTASETTVDASNRRVTTFIVTVVDVGTEFTCSLLDTDGTTVLDQQTISVDVYVLPYLQSPPTIVLNYTSSTEVTVRWLPWETDGGGDGPILRYEVVYRNKSDVEGDTSYDYKLSLDSNQTASARVTGLRTEQEYDFAVVVVREGEGGAGMPSNKTTMTTNCLGFPTLPPIIDSLTAISSTELQLMWRLPDPSSWGCRKIDSIYINLKESTEDFGFPSLIESADSPGVFNITNLLSCTTYDVLLYISTRNGFSPASVVKSASTFRTVPSRVPSLRLENAPHGVGIVVYWSPPEGTARRCHNGTYYVYYTLLRLEACDTDVASPTTDSKGIYDDSTSTTLEDLIPYSTYNVSVVSSNELGNSTVTLSTTQTTIPTFATVLPPVQVTDVTARSFVFRWERIPCEDLHGGFTAYRYIVINNKTGEQITNNVLDIDDTMKMLDYLRPCTPYDIQMTLVNDRGEGDRSENVRVTMDTQVPQRVQNVVASSVDENPSELNLMWEEPTESWCPIKYYRVSYELVEKYKCETVDDTVLIVAGNASQLSYTITDLLPFSRYFVYVEAYTEGAGFGMPGRDVQDTAEKVPTAPPDSVEVVDVLRRELSFSCGYPDCTAAGRSSRILGFTYNLTDVNPGNPSIVIEGQHNYQAFGSLVPNTWYSLRVRLRTNAGDGPYSEPIEATTLEDRPGPPSNVTINEVQETMMTVTWAEPIEPNGNVTDYQVQHRAKEKPYDPSFTSPSSWVVSPWVGPSVLSSVLTQLEPSTKYQILLSARTLVGRGDYVSVEAFTKPKTDIPTPAPPTVDTSISTETTVAISLPNEDDTYVTSYLIAVKTASSKRAAVDIDGESFSTYNDNPNAYIAAEISKMDKTDSFVVGDGLMYGDYLNAPLVTGTMYSIMIGSASRTNVASTVSWSEPLVATARSYGSGPKPPVTPGPKPDIIDPPPMAGDATVGIIAAVVIVVIILVAVTGFAVVLYLKRKRIAQELTQTDETQMKDREVNI